MTELSADQRRSIADRQQGTRTLGARVATIDRASGDLVTLLERIGETVADPGQLHENRAGVVENRALALEHARTIRGAVT